MKNLKEYVNNWINEQPKLEREDSINHVLQYGCQSGSVTDLIYYADTIKFFEDYKEEINELLSDLLNDCGFDSPCELFGSKWDKEDSLILETSNQNLLAWFAFEETLRVEAEELNLISN